MARCSRAWPAAALLIAVLAAAVSAAPAPPKFPDSFEARGDVACKQAFPCAAPSPLSADRCPQSQIEYTFALPYVRVVQSHGLRYPVRVFRDAQAGLLRTDLYNGLDSTFISKVRCKARPAPAAAAQRRLPAPTPPAGLRRPPIQT
jgi:hypothetical protein